MMVSIRNFACGNESSSFITRQTVSLRVKRSLAVTLVTLIGSMGKFGCFWAVVGGGAGGGGSF